MIRLTRINHAPFVLNSDLIEHVEITADTIITLTTGQKLVVIETADEVIERVKQFRRDINQCFYRENPIPAPTAEKPEEGGN